MKLTQPAIIKNASNCYPAMLTEAWSTHLAARCPNAPTVISTFAGCGGSSLGYSMTGYWELLAVEWDDNAVATFKLNFPGVPVYHGDIVKLTVEQALEMTGLRPGELDVLDGSPPCQGFSTAGKRQIEDPRNDLFKEYVRLLRGLQPRAFVMENVSGMVKGKMKLVFADIMRELKASGYRVSARLMNAMYFGVPQSRARLIFIGVRNDLAALGVEPSHPKAVTRPVTLREALRDVACEQVPELSPKFRRLAPFIRPGQCAADVDRGKGFTNSMRARWDRPLGTVTKTNSGSGFGTHLHPVEHRSLSIPEAKRVCSFPDEFQLVGSFEQRWARLGNSVPPLFMRAIADHIHTEILQHKPLSSMLVS